MNDEIMRSLERLEAGQLRIEERLRLVEQAVAEQRGKATAWTVVVSGLISSSVLLLRYLGWKH